MTEVTDDKRNLCDRWIDLSNTSIEGGVHVASERGVDMVFDVVGGPLFAQCLNCLAHRGRQVAISSSGDGTVTFNLRDFYHREAQLFGVDSLALSFEQCRLIFAEVAPMIASGILRVPDFLPIPFSDALAAYKDGKPHKKPVMRMLD